MEYADDLNQKIFSGEKAQRLDGVSPYQWRPRENFTGRATLCGAAKQTHCSRFGFGGGP